MSKVFKVSTANMPDTFIFPKFALQVHKILYDKFPRTYFVGGAVRNALLHQKISDIDIATEAKPEEIVKILKKHTIKFDDKHKRFGIIVADGIEIATFRKDLYTGSRYPKVRFIKTAKADSIRRDFTINALYYNPVKNELLDFHNGRRDIKAKIVRFIGNAAKRIEEDPLRVVRAHRFKLQYNLKFEKQTALTLTKNKNFLKKISQIRITREINCVKSLQERKQLQKVIHNVP